MCFKVTGVKFSWINERGEIAYGLIELMDKVSDLNDKGFMQGGLDLDNVFYCAQTKKATCIDWGQFTRARHPQIRFQGLSPAYFAGVDMAAFGAQRRQLDTLAFSWMLAHLCNAYERINRVLTPATAYHKPGEEDERKTMRY